MNTTELYIENYKVDLSGDVVVPLNLWVQTIKDISKRTSTYSKTIRIPGTKQNNIVFGHTWDLNINTNNGIGEPITTLFNRKKRAEFNLVSDGVSILSGTVQLTNVSNTDGKIEYSVNLFGELVSLINSIGDRELNDLDGESLNHIFTLENITGSWSGSTDYVYPLIDYGVDNMRMESVTMENLRPAVYAKWYWDKIMEEADFNYESDFINSDLFSKLIIPYNGETIEREFELSRTIVSNTTQENLIEGDKYYPLNVALENEEGYYNTSTQTYTAPVSGAYEFVLEGEIGLVLQALSYTDPSYNGDTVINREVEVLCYLEVNGTVVETQNIIFPEGRYESTVDGTGFIGAALYKLPLPFSFYNIDLQENDQVRVSFSHLRTGTDVFWNVDKQEPRVPSPSTGFATQTLQDAVVMNTGLTSIPGSELTFKQFVPNEIKQKDFVTGILRLFNLYTYDDPNEPRKLIIKERDDYYSSGSFHDWTEKVDRNSSISNELVGDTQVKTLQFKYKKDDNDLYSNNYIRKWNREYGERRVDTGYEYSSELKDVLELPFGTVIPIQYNPNFLSGDTRIEVTEEEPTKVKVLGYTDLLREDPTESEPDLPQFRRNGIGRTIRIGEWTGKIVDDISPWEFEVDTPVDALNSGLLNGINYRVFSRTFQYTGFPDKVVPIITEEDDSEESGGTKPYDSELRICAYNGLVNCEEYTLFQTPVKLDNSTRYRYNKSITKSLTVTQYPFTSHVIGTDPTSFTDDLLFQRPNEIYWSLSGAVASQEQPLTETLNPNNIDSNDAILRQYVSNVTDNNYICNYGFEWREVGSPTWNETPTANTTGDGFRSYSLTGLTPDTNYEYRGRVKRSDSTQWIYGSVVTFQTQVLPLNAPQTLIYNLDQPNCEVDLTWDSVTEATSYILQRSIGGGIYQTIYSGPNLTHTDNIFTIPTIQQDLVLNYRVEATDGTRNSEYTTTQLIINDWQSNPCSGGSI